MVHDSFGRARGLGSESGHYYYRARYYNPALGRFLTEDPSKFFSREINLFKYGKNNPSNYIDPDGEFAIFLPCLVGGVLGAFGGGVVTSITDSDLCDEFYNRNMAFNLVTGFLSGCLAGSAAVYGGAIGWAFGALAGVLAGSETLDSYLKRRKRDANRRENKKKTKSKRGGVGSTLGNPGGSNICKLKTCSRS